MRLLKSILPFAASALVVSSALANTPVDDYTPVEPAVIEQLGTPQESSESVPEPGTFGAICLGIATVIYARRWRRRN